MRVLIDMNLTPEWIGVLNTAGHEAVYWSSVGAVDAPDIELLSWAAEHGAVVFTNDLDFGTLLFGSGKKSPSVVQVRGGHLLPEDLAPALLAALTQFGPQLTAGALLVINEDRVRVRLLPLP